MMMQVQTQIKERPFPMYEWEIRAILDGRKTQARRVVKPQPTGNADVQFRISSTVMTPSGPFGKAVTCPYRAPGDRLWVREKHKLWLMDGGPEWSCLYAGGESSDGLATWDEGDQYLSPEDAGLHVLPKRWRPSIHMPRWASRILLEITGVRVERVQDISTVDCWAEGIAASPDVDPRHEFMDLWDSINADRSFPWEANPWVWVVEFRIIKPEATP